MSYGVFPSCPMLHLHLQVLHYYTRAVEVIRLSIRIPYYLAPEIERTLNILHRLSVLDVQNYHQTILDVRP